MPIETRVSMKKASNCGMDLVINSMDPDQVWNSVGHNPGSTRLWIITAAGKENIVPYGI